MLRRVLLTAAFAVAAPAVAAQSRSAALLGAAQARITAHEWTAADTALGSALASALYVMDSVNVFIWRGILEHMRGNDSLARLSFRRLINEHRITSVEGLDKVSPGLDDLFESEARPYRVYTDSQVDQRAAWVSGPKLAYPPQFLRARVSGHAMVRAVVDTLGEAEGEGLIVVESPDPAFDEPLQQMVLAAQFSPARRKGHAVRSVVTLGFDLHPPAPENPTRLITAAREQVHAHHADSALALTEQALDSVNQPTAGERVYALLVRGRRCIRRDATASRRSHSTPASRATASSRRAVSISRPS